MNTTTKSNVNTAPQIVLPVDLRDYFAAAFLQGTAARDLEGTAKERAEAAYHMADAMLAERNK